MAVEQKLVDLRAVAAGCEIPYSTLARWASKHGWPPTKQGKRNLYSWDLVKVAVAKRA
jgi:hypothetical protein